MDNNMVDLSIVIPFYGDPADTLNLVDQIQAQESVASVQIIVSDDASPQPFPELSGVTTVRREFNGGFGVNVNTGVAVAEGKWVLILNSDLTLPDGFIDDICKAAEEEQAFYGGRGVMVAPHIVGHDNESQWVGRFFPKTRHHAWEWFTPVARFRPTRVWHAMAGHDLACTTGKRAEPDWLMGACMMIRREDFNTVGGMDERFFMNSEEVDLQRRLATHGIRRIFRGDIVIEHVGGGSSGASVQRRQWVLDSRFIYNSKWIEGKHLATALRIVSIGNFLFNSIRAVRNRTVTPYMTLHEELTYIKKAESRKQTINGRETSHH
ncbi:glycosyltransferase family 2 protein [Rothia nasimurium]|uniref:Glycosyltransferase family 2 protein n=1 Tax=Rothia nasimurium TaxID=85336 RepID=A0A4Y9F9E7_9MICC|nr:glycosyltransferase family 2 protein [Rothia nasimurium]MBF0807033.1 glycosyltransferase family 2 protein [Rothia nasimurium]TFU24355.1 glycosyltransferase family 2 protein [Rothia nasimurium]